MEKAHHIVIYKNTFKDCGINNPSVEGKAWNSADLSDVDSMGTKLDKYASDIWFIENLGYHNYGSFIALGDYNNTNSDIERVYIGRNEAYENRQSAIGVKRSTDVIISENHLHSSHFQQLGVPPGGIVIQYGPERVWALFNEIHDLDAGIRCSFKWRWTSRGRNLFSRKSNLRHRTRPLAQPTTMNQAMITQLL